MPTMAPGPSGREVVGEPAPVEPRPPRPVRKPRMPGNRVPDEFMTPFRPDAWLAYAQPRSTYITTNELADRLSGWSTNHLPRIKRYASPETVYRWCKRDWFGPLPKGRTGRGNGYRLPPQFEYVARLWHSTEDPQCRKQGLRLLTEQDPKSWLIVVAHHASLHYTEGEVEVRVARLLGEAKRLQTPLHVINIGPVA